MKGNQVLKGNKKSAFTLIELMVAITIIAIITSISVFGLSSIRQKAADTGRLAGMRDMQLAIEGFKNITGKYPAVVNDLVPNYINKLPADKPQDTNYAGIGFKYVVDADKKSYCVGVKDTVFKNSIQPDLVDGTKSWKFCKGPTPPSW